MSHPGSRRGRRHAHQQEVSVSGAVNIEQVSRGGVGESDPPLRIGPRGRHAWIISLSARRGLVTNRPRPYGPLCRLKPAFQAGEVQKDPIVLTFPDSG